MSVIELKGSNKLIKSLIELNKPFSVARLGWHETNIAIEYNATKRIHPKYLSPPNILMQNCGIYSRSNDVNKFKLFAVMYLDAIKHANILASFTNNNDLAPVVRNQNLLSKAYKLAQINYRSLEPFYAMMEGESPWTHALMGKKVLIINPFVNSFKKQMDAGFEIFKDKRVFQEGQEFVWYKSYQTIAGNHLHNDWYETFMLMCNDIAKLDFDVALLGCGGYGLPLCNFIKTKLHKSAIYVGGGLQLLFGVMGHRWEKNDMWQKIIRENDTKFIRPSGEEVCNNNKSIEGGCYW